MTTRKPSRDCLLTNKEVIKEIADMRVSVMSRLDDIDVNLAEHMRRTNLLEEEQKATKEVLLKVSTFLTAARFLTKPIIFVLLIILSSLLGTKLDSVVAIFKFMVMGGSL